MCQVKTIVCASGFYAIYQNRLDSIEENQKELYFYPYNKDFLNILKKAGFKENENYISKKIEEYRKKVFNFRN